MNLEIEKLEKAFYENKFILNHLLNSIHIRVFWKDLNSVYLGCNQIFAEDAGRKMQDEVIGRTDYDFWPDEAEAFQSDDHSVMSTGTPKLSIEKPQTTAEGGIAWLNTTKIPLKDSNGEIYGILGFYEDITEKRLGKILLHDRKAELEQVFTAMPEALVYSDTERNIIRVNPAFTSVFNYESEEVIGKKLETLFQAPADFIEQEKILSNISTSKMYEIQYRRKNGNTFFGETVSTPIRDSSDNLIGYIQHIRDITERKHAEEQIEKQRTFLQRVIDSDPNFIFVKDRSSRFVLVNKSVADAYGSTVEDLIGKSDSDFSADEDEIENFHLDDIDVIDNRKEKFIPEEKITTADGSVRWLQTIKRPIVSEDGMVHQLLGVSSDITERKKTEKVLIESESVFRGIFEQAAVGVALVESKTGRFIRINQHYCNMLGYTMEEMCEGKTFQEITHPDDLEADLGNLELLLNGKIRGFSVEKRYCIKDDSIVWVKLTVSPTWKKNEDPSYHITVAEDITDRKKSDELLAYQASHDMLTGLVNRREFEHCAEHLISNIHRSKKEHAFCFMDLDQFKVVNDTCGHVAGDELLRQVSALFKELIRESDTLARLGGDEFAVLMEQCSVKEALRVANSLLASIQSYQFSWEDHRFKIGVSIGLVPITSDTSNLTELMKQADVACYMAKDLGRNRIHVYHTNDTEMAQRHGEIQWVTKLNQAIEQKRFCLYAQPILALNDSKKIHYELLIRMIDENDNSIISPGAFLSVAERYNLIERIDSWVIENAFKELAANPKFLERIDFVSINLSGQTLTKQNILDFIISNLEKYGIDGNKVCFEITETAAISNLSMAMNFISTLKKKRCLFALDDFGSGLSSFGYLKNLPVDYLKIDGMFVKGIVDDPIDHAMVKSINEIGQVMGMQTIAEFVENDMVKGMLKEIGVDYVQGYGVGEPHPLKALFN